MLMRTDKTVNATITSAKYVGTFIALLIASAPTYIEAKNKTAQIEHEATTSKIGEDQIFYCNQRGIDTEKAIALIVNGFSKDVLNKLPMEFAVEAQKLLEISLEGSVG